MRRIIERVVTVVTTTTWKISWEQDLNASQPLAEAAAEEFSDPGNYPASPAPASTITEVKEATPPETRNVFDLQAERPQDALQIDASKKRTQDFKR